MAHDQIRLDDLLTRDVSVQWFEGVALIQALCRQLSPRSGADGMFPDPSQITLASDGAVTIGGAAATRAVPAAGHLLARMLSDEPRCASACWSHRPQRRTAHPEAFTNSPNRWPTSSGRVPKPS